MAQQPIWPGSGSAVSGSTPFGFYDEDSDFQTEAPQFATWCARRLGYPLADVELQSGSFFTAFEEAVTTYGNELYAYKVRENYLSLEGSNSITEANNKLIKPNSPLLSHPRRQAGGDVSGAPWVDAN